MSYAAPLARNSNKKGQHSASRSGRRFKATKKRERESKRNHRSEHSARYLQQQMMILFVCVPISLPFLLSCVYSPLHFFFLCGDAMVLAVLPGFRLCARVH
jgi:hypothetical protein